MIRCYPSPNPSAKKNQSAAPRIQTWRVTALQQCHLLIIFRAFGRQLGWVAVPKKKAPSSRETWASAPALGSNFASFPYGVSHITLIGRRRRKEAQGRPDQTRGKPRSCARKQHMTQPDAEYKVQVKVQVLTIRVHAHVQPPSLITALCAWRWSCTVRTYMILAHIDRAISICSSPLILFSTVWYYKHAPISGYCMQCASCILHQANCGMGTS